MKLHYHKINLTGHWLRENEINNNYTDKKPPNNGYQWNEEINDWELKPVVVEPEEDTETDNKIEE